MSEIWSKLADSIDREGPDYWEYFGGRLVEYGKIKPGTKVLDVGCGTGSSLFPAAEQAGKNGYAVGIDICRN